METSKAYQSLVAKLFSIQNEFVKYSGKVNFLQEQVGVTRKLVLTIEIPESLSMTTKKKKRKSPSKRRREMARLQAFRERRKNTLSNKNVTQSINTQSSNEKVVLLKQSPPIIDSTIDGETLYGSNLSESETAACEQLIDHTLDSFRKDFSNLAAEFRSNLAAEFRNHISHTSVEMNANLHTVNEITADHSTFDIAHPKWIPIQIPKYRKLFNNL
jgi:hypothetical protein